MVLSMESRNIVKSLKKKNKQIGEWITMNEELKYKDEPLAYKEFPEKELRQKYPNLKDDTIQVMKKCFYEDGLDKKTYRFQQLNYYLGVRIAEETGKDVKDIATKEFDIKEDDYDIICDDYSYFSYYSLSWH